MGLDMYLYAEKYVGGWDFGKEEEQKTYKKIYAACGLKAGDVCKESPSLTVSLTVMYWRKANAIHGWFVDKVQEGVDECEKTYVERDKLVELVTACDDELSGRRSELEPRSGFFFGSVEKDEWYKKDLEYTRDKLKEILANPRFDGWEFYYRSSW